MDVKDLCLGALTFGDASGYDIKKFFENTFSHFYVAGYGSIYPALAELTQEKLVSCRTLSQRGKPDRKLYRLTAAGRRAFLGTLRDTTPRHQLKSEFLVLMYFAHLLPPAQLQSVVEKQLQTFKTHLGHIQDFETCSRTHSEALSTGARFVCGYGKTVISAARKFIHANLRELETAPQPRSRHTQKPPHHAGYAGRQGFTISERGHPHG